MKTIFTTLLLCLAAQVSQAGMRFEVQPLTIQSQQQVIGMQADQRHQNQKAIIYTGQAAQQVAQSAGQYIDEDSEMVVATGPEVDGLLVDTLGGVYSFGQVVLVTSAAFAAAGIKLAISAIAIGVGIAWVGIAAGITIAKTAVYIALAALAVPFLLFRGARYHRTRASKYSVWGSYRHACRVPGYFRSYGRHSCAY